MSTQIFKLKLKSTHQESEKVPDFVDDIQNKCKLNDELSGNLMLLLSEAVTNAIEHGNEFDPKKTAEIEVEVTDTEVIANIKDQGAGFKPAEQENPLEEKNLLKDSGRGVFLLKELSDEMEYLDGGTRLRFLLKRN
jgi:serine/threonine-protein kinase RsbW